MPGVRQLHGRRCRARQASVFRNPAERMESVAVERIERAAPEKFKLSTSERLELADPENER